METITVPIITDELKHMQPFVIVEPGGTHEGKLDGCHEHIALAKAAGANAIKFQWLSSAKALAKKRNAPQYETAYENIAFPAEWHEVFAVSAHGSGLQYGCSVYLQQDVEIVGQYVDFFKISSFEASDLELLRMMTIYEKPIYVSLGMRSENEARKLMNSISGEVEVPVYFLYCVTGYPCPTRQLNLAVLTSHIYHGLSDHSKDESVGARAYAAGARIFEVHTRLRWTRMTNADYAVALTYSQLTRYIHNIIEQQIYFGDSLRKVQPIESTFLPYCVN